jgi:hypothetical protein
MWSSDETGTVRLGVSGTYTTTVDAAKAVYAVFSSSTDGGGSTLSPDGGGGPQQ